MDHIFKNNETLIGYIETDSGTLLLTDGTWEDNIPKNTQEKIKINLELESCKIPVIALQKSGKRFLILAIDSNITTEEIAEVVQTFDPVKLPEETNKTNSEEIEK
jgi:hypothetical protein